MYLEIKIRKDIHFYFHKDVSLQPRYFTEYPF